MKPKEVQEDLAVQEFDNILVISMGDYCCLKDKKLNYTLPITFSNSEKSVVNTLAKEIDYLVKEHERKVRWAKEFDDSEWWD